MSFKYRYYHNEANFGRPIKSQIKHGTHITLEIIPKKDSKFIALRRDSIPGHESGGTEKLYFCHNLIRFGESVEECVKRIVKEQAGVNVKSFRVVDLESVFQKKDSQWAVMPYVVAEVDKIPKKGNYGNKIYEVVAFDKNHVPSDFAWWTKKEVKEFIEKIQ